MPHSEPEKGEVSEEPVLRPLGQAFPDLGTPEEVKDTLNEEHELATQEDASEVIELSGMVENPSANEAYTVTVDLDRLSSEDGEVVDSDEFRRIYNSLEEALEKCIASESGFESAYRDTEFKSIGFTGRIQEFEQAYIEAVQDSRLHNELGNYVSIERLEEDYE